MLLYICCKTAASGTVLQMQVVSLLPGQASGMASFEIRFLHKERSLLFMKPTINDYFRQHWAKVVLFVCFTAAVSFLHRLKLSAQMAH